MFQSGQPSDMLDLRRLVRRDNRVQRVKLPFRAGLSVVLVVFAVVETFVDGVRSTCIREWWWALQATHMF